MTLKTKVVLAINGQTGKGGFDGRQLLVNFMSRLENWSFANTELCTVWVFEVLAVNCAHVLLVVRVERLGLFEVLITSLAWLFGEVGLVVRTLFAVVYWNAQLTWSLATTLATSALSTGTNSAEMGEVGDILVDYVFQFPLNVIVYSEDTCRLFGDLVFGIKLLLGELGWRDTCPSWVRESI